MRLRKVGVLLMVFISITGCAYKAPTETWKIGMSGGEKKHKSVNPTFSDFIWKRENFDQYVKEKREFRELEETFKNMLGKKRGSNEQ